MRRNCTLIQSCNVDAVNCDFSQPPTVDLTADRVSFDSTTEPGTCGHGRNQYPCEVPVSSNLSWTTGYVSSCTASWTGGSVNLPSGSGTVYPQSPSTTYTLTCTNGYSFVSDTVIITIGETPPPPPPPPGGGDECSVILTPNNLGGGAARIDWEAENVDSCNGNSDPADSIWDNYVFVISGGDGEGEVTVDPSSVTKYVLDCDCEDDATVIPSSDPPLICIGSSCSYEITWPSLPFIEEINPGSARFNIFDFFRRLVSSLVTETYAG